MVEYSEQKILFADAIVAGVLGYKKGKDDKGRSVLRLKLEIPDSLKKHLIGMQQLEDFDILDDGSIMRDYFETGFLFIGSNPSTGEIWYISIYNFDGSESDKYDKWTGGKVDQIHRQQEKIEILTGAIEDRTEDLLEATTQTAERTKHIFKEEYNPVFKAIRRAQATTFPGAMSRQSRVPAQIVTEEEEM